MKKLVQRTKGFEKAFLQLQPRWRKKFIQQLKIFLENEMDPRLKTHPLQGSRKGEWSFSVTHDIRAIYRKTYEDEVEILTFIFVDIGTHNRVY